MAKTVIGLEVNMNSSGAEGSVKSLKAQLREAQAEVAKMGDKFGETSIQAQNAARKAAELKDKIGDAKALTDSFNPDAKFKSFSSAIQGVVGGFTALQGAQALFGVKSEELEKTLLKVQGAMALSQGLNALGEAGDAFKLLGVKAVAAFNSIRTAIGSTGIGVLVIAIGAVVAAMMEYVNESSAVEQATKRMKEEEERYKKSLENTADEIQRRNQISDYSLQKDLTNAKARGASVKELRKIETDYFTQKIIDAEEEERLAKKNTEVNKEKYGTENQIYKDSVKALKDRTSEREKLYQQYYLRLAQFDLEDFERTKKIDKKKIEESEQLRKARESGEMLMLEQIERNYEIEAQLRSEAFDEEFLDYADRQLMLEDAANQEMLLAQSVFDLKSELDAQEKENKLKAASEIAASTMALSDLVGKQTAVGKALAIAATTIETYSAAQSAYKRGLEVPYVGMVLGPLNAAIAIAQGLQRVKAIAAVKVPGSSSSASISGTVGTSAPIGTQMGATALQQAQINAAGNAAVQAFVLESDVSGNQERIERLNRAARIQ